jgi:hypothetical protein
MTPQREIIVMGQPQRSFNFNRIELHAYDTIRAADSNSVRDINLFYTRNTHFVVSPRTVYTVHFSETLFAADG